MAVPLSPDELTRKSGAYTSTRPNAAKPRFWFLLEENWQQAAAADNQLAELYDSLGMAEYEAIEGFRRYEYPKVDPA